MRASAGYRLKTAQNLLQRFLLQEGGAPRIGLADILPEAVGETVGAAS